MSSGRIVSLLLVAWFATTVFAAPPANILVSNPTFPVVRAAENDPTSARVDLPGRTCNGGRAWWSATMEPLSRSC